MGNSEKKIDPDDVRIGKRVKVPDPEEEYNGEIVAIDFRNSSVIVRKDNGPPWKRFFPWAWDDLYEEKK